MSKGKEKEKGEGEERREEKVKQKPAAYIEDLIENVLGFSNAGKKDEKSVNKDKSKEKELRPRERSIENDFKDKEKKK